MTRGIFQQVQANDLAAVREALAREPGAAGARDRGLGSTPLHFAAHRGFEAIVDALLAAGADVHAVERVSGTTALHWAAEGGHASIAQRLLECGAALEGVDTWFDLSPLGWATAIVWNPAFHENRAATAEILITAGAAIGVFPAVGRRNTSELRQTLATRPGAVADRLGFVGWRCTPLHLAVDRGAEAVVAALLDAGADPNARSALGLTPLAHATPGGAIAQLLERRGARADAGTSLAAGDVDAMVRDLASYPRELISRWLFAAARTGQEGAVAALLEHGADPSVAVDHLLGELPAPVSALHAAVTSRSSAIVRALLEGGADPNPGAAGGDPTPLHLAAGAGDRALVELLLAHGADRAVHDRIYDATPAGWAAFAGHGEIPGLTK